MSDVPLQVGLGVAGRPGSVWLAVGAALLGLGTLYFLIRGAGVDDARARRFYAVTTLIPAIAFASYLAMLLGFGVSEVTMQGRGTVEIYWARYADWLFTTPLLLVDLGLLAGVDRETLFGAVAADAFMIVTGLVAALSRVQTYRYVWWGVSAFAFLLVAYFLLVTLTDAARERTAEIESTFRTLRSLTLGLWTIYPLWWLAGTEGAGLLPISVETLGFAVLDVLAKVGFGLLLLRSRAVRGEASAPDPTPRSSADPAE
jgi:bacteriorhodopsin